eukprot:GILK01004955.1.p1 GENE.GILK01004955.1~~GILK01004955.1.p1  ORF type:complete len:513 (+),score=55.28 GILK01004955.1:35-1573(+)
MWQLVICALLLLSFFADGLRLPSAIGDNMVLQRSPLSSRVWGWAAPGSKVLLSIRGDLYEQVVSNNGQWNIKLAPYPSSGPFNMTIYGDMEKVVVQNIMFGDVFLCSGQSNMEMTVLSANDSATEIQNSFVYSNIRLMSVEKNTSTSPLDDMHTRKYQWLSASPAAMGPEIDDGWTVFSATCYFFGRSLYEKLKRRVAIGLVASSWGGTYVQAWSSPDALSKCIRTSSDAERLRHVDPQQLDLPLPLHDDNPNRPSVLYHAMISPLLPMVFRGAAWYQGESNAGDALYYSCAFPAMIADWRVKFQNPAMAFTFVQLAAYEDGGGHYSALRVAQTAALNLPSSGMASAVDLGDRSSPVGAIHPRWKQQVGFRLSLAMHKILYDASTVASGPIVINTQLTSSPGRWTIQISFDPEVSQGLYQQGSIDCTLCCSVSPFEGLSNGTWVPVAAEITRQVAVVSYTTQELAPLTSIRYAWADYPQCILYNSHSLPAPPFLVTLVNPDDGIPTDGIQNK